MVFTDAKLLAQGLALTETTNREWFGVTKTKPGHGIIYIGTKPRPPIPIQAALKWFVITIMHEQGHRYGLGHSKDLTSIMCPDSKIFNRKFDPQSRNQLLKALKRES